MVYRIFGTTHEFILCTCNCTSSDVIIAAACITLLEYNVVFVFGILDTFVKCFSNIYMWILSQVL